MGAVYEPHESYGDESGAGHGFVAYICFGAMMPSLYVIA